VPAWAYAHPEYLSVAPEPSVGQCMDSASDNRRLAAEREMPRALVAGCTKVPASAGARSSTHWCTFG
jgi:hypothetical protein